MIPSATVTAGGLNFIFSGGQPWGTAGTMNAIMGRDVSMGFFALAVCHFLVALLYCAIIGAAIYRLTLIPSIFAGVAVGIVLYGINFAIFHGLGGTMKSPESRAFFTHVIFSLFASAVYKGASVPKPRLSDDEAEDKLGHPSHGGVR